MSEINPGLNEIAELDEVSKEELTSATDVLLVMMKTSKGFKMYLPNNPLLTRFVDELNGKMRGHLARYGEFKIDIDQFELRYKGKTIYENREPKESIAFKMYSDGIRFLIFSEGIEESELCDFLEIVGKERPGDVDDDIVTLLWEKNLPNVTYILAEDFLEFDSVGDGSTGPVSQQDKIFGIYRSISPTDVPPPLAIVPQKILVLTDEEAEWLKKAKESDEKKKPIDEVIQILTSIIIGEKSKEVFGEFLEIMTKLIENLINAGEVRYAFNLLKFLGNLTKNDQIPAEKRELIAGALQTMFSEEIMRSLAATVDRTDLLTPEELMEMLYVFGESSLDRICQLLAIVEKMKMRRVIIQVLVELGHDVPEAFFPYLSDQRWYLVRNMAFILARIANPVALEPIVALISSKEPRVRREVLSFLERTPDPKAKTYIMKFLRDDSSALRIRALQVLAGTRSMFALKSITALAASEQFQEKEMAEKKAVFEAMGELGADQMLPMFRDMLLKKFWFNKAKEKESVILAVSGLMKIRSGEAASLLEEASAVKGDEMREIIAEAIAALNTENVKGAAGQ